MTNTPAQPDRLDRMEALVGNILIALDQLRLRQEITQAQIDALTGRVDAFVQEVATAIGTLAQESDADRAAIRELQSENRRILDILENRFRPNGNQPG
jgi:hypothetical protein